MSTIRLKRIYEEPNKEDGIRILVDRLWPRGVSKEKAKLNYWLKELGPSNELRKEFNHDAHKYETFKKKYKEELKTGKQKEAFNELKKIIEGTDQRITLLYAAKDEKNNNAQVIKQVIQ